MEYKYKEVDFCTYCKVCKYRDNKEADDPCYDCLAEGANEHSHKPIKFTPDSTKMNRKGN